VAIGACQDAALQFQTNVRRGISFERRGIVLTAFSVSFFKNTCLLISILAQNHVGRKLSTPSKCGRRADRCYNHPSTSTELCLNGPTTYLTTRLLNLQSFCLHSFIQFNVGSLVRLFCNFEMVYYLSRCLRHAYRISPVA